ncbi:hypothetical protein RGQ29_006352 [Quercus rubra]|uniref:G domain-containing protein n=1 Tax=Quercus rubra TaxID=3512 RepID=A0AAN7E713_QUERU|nr:hypothetical protein RGQ29_006352 [Quercus rubra]
MQGVELSLFYSSSSSTTLSKTLSLLSPIPIPKPPSLFSPIHLSLSLSLSKRSLPHHISRFSGTNQQQQQPPKQNQNQNQDEEESDGEDIDVAALEEEARNAAREYSTSLSRQLTIEDEPDVPIQRGRKQSKRKITTINIPDHLLPRVAIVGRPNVGKSALFNRLVGGNRAIVVDEPGVTRDRLYGRSFWGEYEFMVVDTGGVLNIAKSQVDVMEDLAITTTIGMDGIPLASREAAVAKMPSMIERQAKAAVEEASVIIFLVDGQAGLTAADEEIGDWLRKNYSNKYVILAVNKCESPRKGLMQASEFWSLGFSPLPISAVSGTGTGELLDLVCSGLKKIEGTENHDEEEEDYVPAIAIVGRPNVGKSSILNALVGEDRTIVSPISGTTRDAIDTEFTGPDGQKFRLIDTAGIRRRAAVASTGSITEALSVNRAFRAVRRSDVVALVIEAMACITEQAAIRPPTFVFFVNDEKLFSETYRRYMEKQLRTNAGFAGTPIRLLWRSRRKMEKDEGRAARTPANLVPRDRKLELAS